MLFMEEQRLTPEQACFGIAGPVLDGKVITPNLPWSIESSDLARVIAFLRRIGQHSLPGAPPAIEDAARGYDTNRSF